MATEQNKNGIFITLEGPEGAGKTTQLKLLSKQLEANNIEHIITRDPGGTSLGKQIRRILLNPGSPVEDVAELLLYEADRAQNVAEIIQPALARGIIVFCDRYTDSTIAYQGYGRGISLSLIAQLNQVATGGLTPELTLLFDIDSSQGLNRLHPGSQDRLEREALDFHHRVRQGYLNLVQENPERWRVIDSSKPFSSVQAALKKQLSEYFSIHKGLSLLLD